MHLQVSFVMNVSLSLHAPEQGSERTIVSSNHWGNLDDDPDA